MVLFVNEAMACHFLGLLQPHDVEDGRGHAGQDTVVYLRVLVPSHVDERDGVDGVCRIGCAVSIDGVAVVLRPSGVLFDVQAVNTVALQTMAAIIQ